MEGQKGHLFNVAGLLSEFVTPSLSNGGDYGGNTALDVLPFVGCMPGSLLLMR